MGIMKIPSLLMCLVFVVLFCAQPALALVNESGSLESSLKAIDYGVASENTWIKPSDTKITQFKQVFSDFLAGNYDTAQQNAAAIGYEVVKYTNTDVGSSDIHYILREVSTAPFTGGGTYVLFPSGKNAVLQAPHPKFDSRTSKQSIETYLSVRPRLLMLSGTHRKNSTAKSNCTDGNYFDSDVAHQTQSLFYAAHQMASDTDTTTPFIQFHGFGSSTLATLQAQCGSSNDKLINISEGVSYATPETENSLLHILRRKVEAGGVIEACAYGNDTTSLGGTFNVEGRYTNYSSNSCSNNATTSSKRFIHLEQSSDVRSNNRDDMAAYIDEALSEYLQKISTTNSFTTLLGVYHGNQGWAMDDVRALESWQEKKNAMITLFTNFNPAQQSNLMTQQLPNIWNNGNIPLISWEPYLEVSDTPDTIEADIANGDYDAYLTSWVTDLKAFLSGADNTLNTGDDRRVYLRLAHEMNGNWYPWSAANADESPQAYIAMWQRIHDIFTTAGLQKNHVQWIWSVNASDHNSHARIAENYYPGDDYVDWLGVDGYNFGALHSYTSWRTPNKVFGNMVSRLRLLANKPIAINETAAQSESGTKITEKNKWIEQLFSYIHANNIQMLSWFNMDKESDWAIFDSTYGNTTAANGEKAYSAYKTAVQKSWILTTDSNNPRLLSQNLFDGTNATEVDGDNDGAGFEANVLSFSGSSTGDGDGDGVDDANQAHVSSLRNHQDSHWLTYRNNSNGTQSNFVTGAVPLSRRVDKHFLYGTIQYDIATAVGQSITIEVYVDKNAAIQDYYLLGNDGKWIAQNATVSHQDNKTKLTFSVLEGGNFDRDATANGLLKLAKGGVTINTGFDVWPYAYLYGNAELGQQTPAKAFSIKNTGSRELTITNASITGNNASEFVITDNACGALSVGATCTISASFSPSSLGSKSAMLTVETDDPDNTKANIFLHNHEADKEESERRLPPVLNSFTIENGAGVEVSSMHSNTEYTVHWSILGYHKNYTSLVVMFDCTDIPDNTSCGDSYSDSSRFLTSGTVASASSEAGIWFHGDVQSKIFNFSYTFTTPDYANSTPIVIRFYRKNSKDLQVGNGSLSLIIPGNQAENYYDTTGRRVKNVISPDTVAPVQPTLTTSPDEATEQDAVLVEVNGEAGSRVFVNGVEVATIGNNGKVTIGLDTSGASGVRDFNITLIDNAGNESSVLQVSINKDLSYLPSTVDNKIAVNFLSAASFGATTESKNTLIQQGIAGWVDDQLAMPYVPDNHLKRTIALAKKMDPTNNSESVEDYLADNETVFNKNEASFDSSRYQMSAWFEAALTDEDQLRHKVAYALSQIIVESPSEATFKRRSEALARYFDILSKHAFGNYRDLLIEISNSSAMGLYLTYNGNKAVHQVDGTTIYPDENYAREIMQLFSIGLGDLNLDGTPKLEGGNPIQTYTQTDVNELSRVFTGWDLKQNSKYGRVSSTQGDFTHPMEFTSEYHDYGEKTLLGTIIPAGNTGSQDIEAAVDILMAHPNIAPFVSKQLIMRLTKSNPSTAYVTRIATVFNNNGFGVKGDLKAVTKAILLDPEWWEDDSVKKFKEPLIAYTQFLRAFKVAPSPMWRRSKTSNVEITGSFLMNSPINYLGQGPSRAFTVFNFYSNDYIPNDSVFKQQKMVAPELQIQTDSILIAFNNKIHDDLFKLEKNNILSKYGTLTDYSTLEAANYNVVYYIGRDKFLLDCTDEYNVIETELEGAADGAFASFNGVKRVDDPTVDANGITDRDRAVQALVTHLDDKLTGGLLSQEMKNTLFEGYKGVLYYNAINNADDPEIKIYETVIAPIIAAIVTSENHMVH